MNHLKNWAIALVGVLALSINNGCTGPDYVSNEADEQAESELGTAEQPLTLQVFTGAGARLIGGVASNVSPPGSSCLTTQGTGTVCVVPPANKQIRISSPSDSVFLAARTQLVTALNTGSLLGGSGWTIVSDDAGTENVGVYNDSNAGGAFGTFNVQRYLSTIYTGGATLSESPAMNGTFKPLTAAAVGINKAKIVADCAALFSGSNLTLCISQSVRHCLTYGVQAALGIATNSLVAVNGFYTSRNMTPILDTKTYFSGGARCRARNYAIGGFPTFAEFTTAAGCSND